MVTSFTKCSKCGYRNKNYKAGQLPCDFSSCVNFVLRDSETDTEEIFEQQNEIMEENSGFSGIYSGFISALQFNSTEEECCRYCESKKFWNLHTDYKCVPSKYCKIVNPLNEDKIIYKIVNEEIQ